MIKFDEEKVLLMYKLLVQETGGFYGIRDRGLLNSSLNSAFQTFGGKDLYPTIQEKAAKLGYSFISNHAFVDGNKRIGILVMLSFLEVNNVHLQYTDNELIEVGLSVARGEMDNNGLLGWIKKHEIVVENTYGC
ncbi:MAG: type II toxin-antitoxin system death-on-curing family toxin [Clostridia bacterium]|nr:type II toxin-antitoxin system death-on-curing family toxin [Clostridia bacterium]